MRCADLRLGHGALHELRHTQVTELHRLAGTAQHVGCLDVAVKDARLVHRLQPVCELDEVAPDLVLAVVLLLRRALAGWRAFQSGRAVRP